LPWRLSSSGPAYTNLPKQRQRLQYLTCLGAALNGNEARSGAFGPRCRCDA
jgi:hypothetical protein